MNEVDIGNFPYRISWLAYTILSVSILSNKFSSFWWISWINKFACPRGIWYDIYMDQLYLDFDHPEVLSRYIKLKEVLFIRITRLLDERDFKEIIRENSEECRLQRVQLWLSEKDFFSIFSEMHTDLQHALRSGSIRTKKDMEEYMSERYSFAYWIVFESIILGSDRYTAPTIEEMKEVFLQDQS